MAVKKKAKKKSSKKAAKKKAVKKRAKKKAAKKKAVKKRATKKQAVKKRGVKKKAARKKSAARASKSPDDDRAEAADDEQPAAAPRVHLRRGRKIARRPRKGATGKARVIPPLPEDDDDFVPAAPSRQNGPTPAELLDRVRTGRAHISAMNALTDDEIYALAKAAGMEVKPRAHTSDIVFRLVNEDPAPAAPTRPAAPSRRTERRERESVAVKGLLELHPDGYGFLRRRERNYSQHPEDVYVAAAIARSHELKQGHWVAGQAHRPRPGQAYLALHEVDEVNHEDPDVLKTKTPFKDLTVVYPDTRLPLETGPEDVEMRVMDLFCPLGMGQRGLIVAPPRTGKTVLLTKLADAVAANSPNVDIVVLLVDERPEEVTNMRRSVRGEVVASTFDKPATNHVRVAELVMDKVRRMVEFGRDVVLLLDSITRLGRAYNNQTGGSGRILSGGLDANALSKPKRFFGSARNVEDGGSLTIIATALVDTGSKMDQVIFEEFKGTGNMEVVLSRDLSNARVWPAIDVPASGTRNEDLLLHPDELQRVIMLRRGITGQDPLTVMQALRVQLKKHSTNAQFLMGLGETRQ